MERIPPGTCVRPGARNRFPAAALLALAMGLSGCHAVLPLGCQACGRLLKQAQKAQPTVQDGRACPRVTGETPSSQRTFALSGCVTNLAGRTAIVRATGPVSRATTTSENCFRIDGLPPGEYRVFVRHHDYSVIPAYQRTRISDRDVGDVNFYAWPKRVRVGR